jgi:hypothetical protein
VPAAAVIPAPRVYTKAVAVKTLVVEFLHPVTSSRERGLVIGATRSSSTRLGTPEKDNPH